MTPNSSSTHTSSAYYGYYLSNMDTSHHQNEAEAWVQPTIIDDDDLTFGGKPLCTWYEEERRRLSSGSHGSGSSGSGSDDEEERRGRERFRHDDERSHQKASKQKAPKH